MQIKSIKTLHTYYNVRSTSRYYQYNQRDLIFDAVERDRNLNENNKGDLCKYYNNDVSYY